MSEIEEIVRWHTLSYNSIIDAELHMGIVFPKSLNTIYQNYGYGFVKNKEGAINRLLDPMTCANIRMRKDIYEFDLDLEVYLPFEKDKLLFFEVNEGVYLSMGINDEKIYYLDRLVANDIFEFIVNISNNPDYWCQ